MYAAHVWEERAHRMRKVSKERKTTVILRLVADGQTAPACGTHQAAELQTGKQGKYMSDTIDWLESIGSNASLRHASTEELTDLLEQAQASEALTAAVASGDRSLLAGELGPQLNKSPQSSQNAGHEEEEELPLEAPTPENTPSPSQQ